MPSLWPRRPMPRLWPGRPVPSLGLGRHARRWATIAVIVVVIAGGGATAWAMAGPSGPAYRTATVTRANVTQTLLATGTIEPVSQANVNFPVSGQVASVSVGLGSRVKAGQVLARLSTSGLASQVSSAQYTVAQATVRLATDQASQSSSTATTTTATTTTSTTSGGGSGGGAGSGSGSGGTGGGTPTIRQLQAAVRAAQQRLNTALAGATALLATEATLCAGSPTPTTSPTPSPSPTSSSPSPSASPTATASPYPTHSRKPHLTAVVHSGPATCQEAVTQLLSAQANVATAEQALAAAEAALSSALSKASGSGPGPGGGSGGGSGSGSGGGAGSGSGAGGSGGGAGSGSGGGSGAGGAGSGSGGGAGGNSGVPATAEQVAADQASLDAANAQLDVARQNLAAATLVAPIAGTVAQVNVTPGQQVSGSQGSSASFIIQGPGGEEATTAVSSANVGQVRVGQPATVTLDGSATSIKGEVVSIGMLSTSSSGSASYPVTIGLTGDVPTLFAGSNAQVSITLARVSNAVAVPTSAVTSLGAFNSVTVLRAGKPVRVRVTVGATGPALTQVSSGLSVGDQVVLADLGTPLPTNSNPFATRGLTGGGGGFAGARPAGGAAGGGVTRTGGGAGG